MAIKSYAEQLEEVQAAISAIVTGAQNYAIGNRSLTRANLDTLYKQEERLLGMVGRQNGTAGQVRGITKI